MNQHRVLQIVIVWSGRMSRDTQNPNDSSGHLSGQEAIAVVVSTKDPDELGRVKIRIIGLQDESTVPDSDLPWTSCSYNNEPSVRGIGASSPNYSVGSRVMVKSLGSQGHVVTGSMPNADPDIAKSDVPEDIKSSTPRKLFIRDSANKTMLEEMLAGEGTEWALKQIAGQKFSSAWEKTSDGEYYKPSINEAKIPDHYKKRKASRSQDKESIGVEQFAGQIKNAQEFIKGAVGERGSLIPGALDMINNLYKVTNPRSVPRPTDVLPGSNLLKGLQGIASFYDANKNNDKEPEELVCENILDLLARKECRDAVCRLLPTQELREECLARAEELYDEEVAQAAAIAAIAAILS